jgi:hypothetical protein
VQWFFFSEILPKFDLKNMISIVQRIFHGKNGPNLPDFEERKFQIMIFLFQ